jgi:hypothetical protein
MGNGTWRITKACTINSEYDRTWYFYDDTNELVWE